MYVRRNKQFYFFFSILGAPILFHRLYVWTEFMEFTINLTGSSSGDNTLFMLHLNYIYIQYTSIYILTQRLWSLP